MALIAPKVGMMIKTECLTFQIHLRLAVDAPEILRTNEPHRVIVESPIQSSERLPPKMGCEVFPVTNLKNQINII
jgi:hypothetical protein